MKLTLILLSAMAVSSSLAQESMNRTAPGAALDQGKPPQCTNPSLTWTIYQSYTDPDTQAPYTSAIQGDSSSLYVDGTPGVIATLFLCDALTLDATLTLGSPRTAGISFSNTLSTNANSPSWVFLGSTATGLLAMDVRSLGYVPPGYTASQEFAFTTRFHSAVPESGSWSLNLMNPSPWAPSYDGQGAVSNPPNAEY